MLIALSTFIPGYLGTSGGRGDHFGVGGGIATILYTTSAVRGGGTAAIGIPIPYSNRFLGGRIGGSCSRKPAKESSRLSAPFCFAC